MGGLPKLAREASQLSDRVSRPQTWDFEIGNIILVGEEIRFELQRKYDLDLEWRLGFVYPDRKMWGKWG